MKRIIPQNYVVLLQNIPSDIDNKDEIIRAIAPISQGLRAIVSVPEDSAELTSLFEKMTSLKTTIDKKHRFVQSNKAIYNMHQGYALTYAK